MLLSHCDGPNAVMALPLTCRVVAVNPVLTESVGHAALVARDGKLSRVDTVPVPVLGTPLLIPTEVTLAHAMPPNNNNAAMMSGVFFI